MNRPLLLAALAMAGAGAPDTEPAARVASPAARFARVTSITATRCGAPLARDAITVEWRGARVRTAEFAVRLGANGVRNRVVAVRVQPSMLHVALDVARDGDAMAPWSLVNAPRDAALAFNAGQFTDAGPWGWVVHRGREWQAPGSGSLAGAMVVDSAGAVHVLDAAEIPTWRTGKRVVEAVQSYPMLLSGDGVAPGSLCDTGSGLDLTHRDTRLAVGTLANGELLVVLTRYELPGGNSSRFPIGPTTPEMAQLMQRLGAVRALMLDGGLSAQLAVRDGGVSREWPGARRVPLAIVVR